MISNDAFRKQENVDKLQKMLVKNAAARGGNATRNLRGYFSFLQRFYWIFEIPIMMTRESLEKRILSRTTVTQENLSKLPISDSGKEYHTYL